VTYRCAVCGLVWPSKQAAVDWWREDFENRLEAVHCSPVPESQLQEYAQDPNPCCPFSLVNRFDTTEVIEYAPYIPLKDKLWFGGPEEQAKRSKAYWAMRKKAGDEPKA